ncbi:MAG: DNA polymerase III subunit delta [Treponema sp.]|nr:DNA polymerase III subunit delta [Treponema sp.]
MSSLLNNVYIFLGPEIGKKQDAVNAIKEKLRGADESIFYPGETGISEIADTLLNISLFADAKIVIVKNAELIKKKDETELLVSCVKKMEDTTVLILLSDELKLAAGLEEGFAQAGMPKNNRQIFYEMFEREKNEWLMSFFRREGYNINKDCVNTILELVENNTDAMKKECTRLMYFLPKDRPVTAEDIEKWLSHNREESAFTLFSRIASGDLSKALESLSVMLAAKESAQGILASLAGRFRKLGDYLSLQETGNANNSFELKKIGLTAPKAKEDFAAAASRYNQESVEACLILTAEYDALLRSPAAIMADILMDRYILSIFKQGRFFQN